MAKITFFEKTGCVNNTKQKLILSLAGHEIEAINIVQYEWTKDELIGFFEGMEVKDWFNKNAPGVTSGQVIPEKFTAETAIEAMLIEHLLIRRPLMLIDGEKYVGFDKELLEERIGLSAATKPKIADLLSQNLNDCPQVTKKMRLEFKTE